MIKRITNISTEDLALNTKVYDVYHNEIGWVDGWEKEDKLRNFTHMLKISKLAQIPLKGKKCLDVGCGTGDLYPYLKKRGIKKYEGIDIYEPSILAARKRFLDQTFILGDLLTGIIKEQFDYTFCSGALSLNLHSNNYQFLESMVSVMWELTTIGLVFNFYTDVERERDPDLFYYNFDRVLSICKEIGGDVKIHTIFDRDIYHVHLFMYRS